jgi:hypothetical protein
MGNPVHLLQRRIGATEAELPRFIDRDDPVQVGITTGLAPFIRENDVNFSVTNLKPGNDANIFFDEVLVNNFSQRASYVNVTSSSAFSSLRINEGLYGSTSKAYAEVLGTSLTSTDNIVYVNDNFLSIRVQKGTSSADLTVNDYNAGDLIYQTVDNLIFNFDIYTGAQQPIYTFLAKVKNWQLIDASNGVLVVDPILGTCNTALTNAASNRIWNLTNGYITLKDAAYIHGNNRFSAGETVTTSSSQSLTIAAANSYVGLSGVVVGANTANSPIRSIVIATNNISRDGLSTLVGNSITIVSGTNMGFKANVVGTVANNAAGGTEAILDATLPAHCTSNTVYSVGSHKVNDVGGLYGIFHIPSENNLRWLTGERVFTITDTATHNNNSYKMRAIAKYTALGKTNTVENARNFVLREQSPSTARAPETITQTTTKVDDRKFMAQTFFTPRSNQVVNGEVKNAFGVYITSVDLFFKTKPTNAEELLPFTVAISPVVNGLPANEIIASKTLEPASINTSSSPTSSNTSTLTRFTFTDPVYLLPETEYAIKLITESGDYQVWTATLGEEYTDSSGNLRRISEQPYIGNFFKAQNASNWNPILNQDLMFQINRAAFSSSNTVFFELNPKTTGTAVDFSTNSVFDMIKVSSTEQQFSPTSITYEVKTLLTDGTATDYIRLNNNEIYNFGKDLNISSATSRRRRLIKAGNTASINVKVTMTTSDDRISPILNYERLNLFTLQNIINNAGIANNLISVTSPGAHSNAANIAVTISAPDVGTNRATANVTAALLSSGKVVGINIINPGSGYFTTPTITIAEAGASSNATAVISGETDSTGGNILAKYQTKIVTLEDGFDSGDLIVRLDAIKPSGTDVQVYFKVLSALDSDPFITKKWQLMTKSRDNISADLTKRVPLEYRHSLTKGKIEYFDGSKTMPLGGTFKQFAVKIRLTSEDPTVVPSVESLRVIAVPGG